MSGERAVDPGRELGLTAAVCAGLLALVTAGGADAAPVGLLVPVAALAPWLRDRAAGAPWTPLLLLSGTGCLAVGLAGAVHEAVSLGLVALLLHQRWAPEADRWDRLVALISALLLLAASRREVGPAFLVAWAMWAASLPFALAPAGPPPPRVEQRARGWRSIWVVAASGAVYLGLPRPPSGPAAEALVGLSDEVVLQGRTLLRSDRTVVAEAWSPEGGPPPTRLRAAALEGFDGVRWSRVAARGPSPPAATGPGRRLTVEQAAVGGAVLLAGAAVAWETTPEGLVGDEAGAWWTEAPGPFEHTATVDEDGPWGPATLGAGERARTLALPASLDPRVAALAARVTAGAAGPGAAVAEIVRAVASSSTYTLDVPEVGGDPLAAFLFDHHRGHCEHHAAAVAAMARAVGVPARVVVGVAGGELDGDRAVFRALDAHAWTEVHLEGRGWVGVDATVPDASAVLPDAATEAVASSGASMPAPPVPAGEALSKRAWEVVTGWDGRDQRALAAAFGRAVPWLLLGVVAWALRVAWRGRAAPEPMAAARTGLAGVVDATFEGLRAAGLVVPLELPPLAAARQVAPELPGGGGALVELAWLYYEVAYGGADEAPRLQRGHELSRRVLESVGR